MLLCASISSAQEQHRSVRSRSYSSPVLSTAAIGALTLFTVNSDCGSEIERNANRLRTDRFAQNKTSEMKNRLQKSYDTRIESARRALSIAVPCIFSRAHSASISPDHFFAAAEITRLRMPPEVCSSEYCNSYINVTSNTSF